MTTPETTPPASTTTPPPGNEDVTTLRTEAKKRRLQLREAESQREALAADLSTAQDQLKTWQVREVRKLVATVVASPETLESLGYNPAAYYGDDHALDAVAALADAEKIRETHGLAAAEPTTALAREVAAELPEHNAIPAELLRGSTADELREHRDMLIEWVRKQFPVMPVVAGENAGSAPLGETDWLKTMINNR